MMRNKITIVIIVLTLVLGILAFWYYQRNTYSKDILKLEILGQDQANLLEEVEYTVKYKNNGNVKLEKALLIFECPSYSIECSAFGVEAGGGQLRKEISLEDIYPGEEKTITVKSRLVGKSGDLKQAKAWLSYEPKNLNARYESETSLTTKIETVSLTLDMDLSSGIESGKDLSFNLNYFSNVDYPVSNLSLRMEYPDGFEFKSSSPKSLDKSEWNIGLLNKAEGGRINIVGIVSGEIEEQKTFKTQLGTWQDGSFIVLKESVRAVKIAIPSLYISQLVNNSPQYIASPGDTLHYEIIFKNIGQEAFSNLFLVARLDGSAFDLGSIRAPQGEFEQGDNSIVFDWRRVSDLQLLNAQEEGKVEFWIDLKDFWPMSGDQDKNPVIKNSVYLSQAKQEFTNKVGTLIQIDQKGYYADEIFGNSGPIPPEVGKTTTYTIMWQAKNYYNDVDNMQVRAVLGKNVYLTGNIFPEGSSLTYDSSSREVVWSLENLNAGKGVIGAGPNISFQVHFTPDSTQKGKTPEIIGPAVIVGEDQFTNSTVQGTDESINTGLPDDETVSNGTVK
jgi:hypothetical protein